MLRFIADRAADAPDALALLAPGRAPLTYAQLFVQVRQHARVLRAIGISSDDRVALLLPDGPEAAIALLATTAVSCCAPLNHVCTADEIDAALALLKPKVLVATHELEATKHAIAAKYGIRVITIVPDLHREAGVFSFGVSTPVDEATDFLIQPNDVALLLQTSGTTSRPKLVGLTHQHLRASVENVARSLELKVADRCLNVMPLFHIHGIVASLLSSLYAGASVVCTSGFLGRHFFQWIEEFKPTWYTAVPTIHAAIAARAEQHANILKRHSLRFIRSCSAPLPTSVLHRLEIHFRVPILEAYGMTEAAHQITCNPLPPAMRKVGSVGVSTGTEIAVMDEQCRVLGPDRDGEIVIRGRSVISSYINVSSTTSNGGWFHTGDIGSIDGDGYLFLKGRSKEFINRGGMKISPIEIEEVLLDHPNVAEAVVFAVPEQRLGEDIAAAVVLRHSTSSTAAEIRDYASDRLTYFKVPRQLILLDKIPKGPTGKLQRIGFAHKVGFVLAEQADSEPNLMRARQTPLEQALAMLWARILGVEHVESNDNFFEIGGDSLSATELLAGIEQITGRRLTVTALFEAPTIAELADFIDAHDFKLESYVVPIQTGGSQPPFFCVGAGPRYRKLAELLGANRPFLGLIHPDNVSNSVESMAEFSVKSIRAVQPEGPYFLGGWCTSGLIAYEISQQLRAQGHAVALLVMFDSVNPGRLDGLSIMRMLAVQADEIYRKIMFHIGFMARLHVRRIPEYFFTRARNVWRTLTERTLLGRARIEIRRPVLGRDIGDELYFLGKRYRAKPYNGRVILFRRSLRPITRFLDEKLGWDGLVSGTFCVVEIQGGHDDMFKEPQVERVASRLSQVMRE